MLAPVHFIRRFLLVVLLGTVLPSCDDGPRRPADDPLEGLSWDEFPAIPATRSVDMIIVVDNSYGNYDGRIKLRSIMNGLVHSMEQFEAGMPDLHVGVITSDLGSSPYNVGGCLIPGGDHGRFVPSITDDAQTLHYLVDVAPRGCPVERHMEFDSPLQCLSHACTQLHCKPEAFPGADGLPTEPAGLTLVTDEQGCPRCRSFNAVPLAQELEERIASLGSGCGWEQHLEALRLALFGQNPENEGFSRPDSLVSVLFFMDEDDCSVADPILLAPAVGTTLLEQLGPLTNYRCTRFGVVCDEPWPDASFPVGDYPMSNCRPRPGRDPRALLHPIARYDAAFGALRDGGRLQVSTISGSYRSELSVVKYTYSGWIGLELDCRTNGGGEGADPIVRMSSFLRALDPGHFEYPSWVNFCNNDYSPVTGAMRARIQHRMEPSACLRYAIAGCTEPPRPPDWSTECAPACRVVEVDGDTRTPVPLCEPEYQNGHPAHLDPNLPQPVCYHVAYDGSCPANSEYDDLRDRPWGVSLHVSMREPAPADRRIEYGCLRPSQVAASPSP